MKFTSIGSQLTGADVLEFFGNFKRSSVQRTPKYMFIWTENLLSSTRSTSKTFFSIKMIAVIILEKGDRFCAYFDHAVQLIIQIVLMRFNGTQLGASTTMSNPFL